MTGVTFGQVGFQSRATFPATPNPQPPPTNINFNFNVSFGDRWISNGHMTVRFGGRWIKIFLPRRPGRCRATRGRRAGVAVQPSFKARVAFPTHSGFLVRVSTLLHCYDTQSALWVLQLKPP